MTTTTPTRPRKHIVIFSGGSAANSLVDVFRDVAEDKGCALSYIIPISDNGGSSSEIIRVFGGPGIGDVRSRLVRLIPTTVSTRPLLSLLHHRLPSDSEAARTEWNDIVHGSSTLITALPPAPRELIRSFLNLLSLEITKRSRPPHSTFNFARAAVGNLFLTGARLFTGSFESAIYLLATLGGIDDAHVRVIPAINSNFSHHIAAGLSNGRVIVGQNAISHPSDPVACDPLSSESELREREARRVGSFISDDGGSVAATTTDRSVADSADVESHDEAIEDANLPGSHPELRKQNISFHKSDPAPLTGSIRRIWYINPYGQAMLPSANPRALGALAEASCIIYCIGSLYTSIVPNLILRGVGEKLAKTTIRTKVLILNGCLDRETAGYDATDFVRAIVGAAMGSCAGQARALGSNDDEDSWRREVEQADWSRFVTHLIYLTGEETPPVNKQALAQRGIECIRIYGRRNGDGDGMYYDGPALGQALGAIVARSLPKDKSRRNTLEK